METLLNVTGLTKKYGRHTALDHFDLQVQKGEIVGIAGLNGAGKTTFMRIIAGLSQETSGEIELFGVHNKKDLDKARKKMGVIIEGPAFIPEFNGKKNLIYYARQRGLKDLSKIDQMLSLVGLDKAGKKSFKQYSLGMKQRLAIALALLHEPNLLIFDEPTNGLDPAGIIQVRELLHHLVETMDLTIIVASHILSELEQLSTRFVILHESKKLAEFSRDDISSSKEIQVTVEFEQQKAVYDLLAAAYGNQDIVIKNNRLLLTKDQVMPEEVAALIVKAGYSLKGLVVKEQSLEARFIELTQGGSQV